jgi:hypothetical protein
VRLLVLCGFERTSTFSYHTAWPRHLAADPRFRCTVVNLLDRSLFARLRAIAVARAGQFDAIVLLHSVFSNARLLDGRLFEIVRQAPQPTVYFIGNEYKLMPEKMAFCAELGIALLISQSSSPSIHRLYHERLGCPVTGIPNTGLDPALFAPRTPRAARPIDIGYRADDSPIYLGHRERRDIAEFFTREAPHFGLNVDISLDPADRLEEQDWAAFLDRCAGQLGTEAGGDYFDLDDRTRVAVNAFTAAHPAASFEDVEKRFFRDYEGAVPLRILSGRNVEAAGTRTVQILFEGHYDGYFVPDEHYIPLKKDFSNAAEAIRKFRDESFSQRIADNAYHLALEQLTYPKLIDRLHSALEALA